MKQEINIVLPMAGKSIFFDTDEYIYPKPLIEINGKTMIELVINNLKEIPGEKKFIFILKEEDCSNYHIDNVVKLLTEGNCEIIYTNADTKGAACTSLLAIEYINNEIPLIISNNDQKIEEYLPLAFNSFVIENFDAAVITFESVHPKWSYVRLDVDNSIIETAEKKPISKHAIAGFYYFKHGKYFVNAAFSSIMKDANVNGSYFIAPVLNELVLENKKLGIFEVSCNNYHSFYSPQKIEEFKKRIE